MSDLSRYDGRYPEPPYPEQEICDLHAAIARLQDERDEARDAARYAFRLLPLVSFQKQVQSRWPWLDDKCDGRDG